MRAPAPSGLTPEVAAVGKRAQTVCELFKALRLLSSALRKGYGLPLLDNDKDWDALRKDPEFRRRSSLRETKG
jgi:hypothetical protein